MYLVSSTIIQEIKALCKAGDASMAYFYFDFRDDNKQGLYDLVTSLLIQLSARSSLRSDILSNLYLGHDEGTDPPSDDDLTRCLKDMLKLPDLRPIYLIIDALDESPNALGIPSPRETVLQLLKELVDLRLSNVHICVTSRLENDIQSVITPLSTLRVSLHNESGQKKDIADYIRSVVYSDSEPIISNWEKEIKDLVIQILSDRSDGMYVDQFTLVILVELPHRFRWAFCQLEILRHCLQTSVHHFLEELPESLDKTYERVLRGIKVPDRDHALRLLHCLVVAIRPLRVEELVEAVAVDFGDASGIPKLKPSLRWKDQDQGLLTSCSSLITIVDTGLSRVVQFSHFSVKEFLTSPRLATPSLDVSRYHVALGPAHTILAEICLSIFLDSLIEDSNVEKRSSLAGYAAEHWVRHAQFEDVASRIRGIEYLFDLDKPYFAAWCQLHDMDTDPSDTSVLSRFTPLSVSGTKTPLYYAALCGFQSLAEQLIDKYPDHVGATGGYYMTPAVAALAGRHFQLAEVLHHKGSSLDPRGDFGNTPLHSAAYYEDSEMVRVLLVCGVDVNAQNDLGSTPLDSAMRGHFNDSTVVRSLLEHGADPNVQVPGNITPLHLASQYGRIEIVRLLVQHGASVEIRDKWGRKPLDVAFASEEQRDEIIYLLSWFELPHLQAY